MPRTGVFFRELGEAFDEPRCTITLEPLAEVQGGLLKVGASTKPYSCSALLRWYDQNPCLPHSREPIGIDDMHPVMTPQTRMQDYVKAVRALAERGWNHEAEVQADTARRGHRRERGAGPRRTMSPIVAMRKGLRSSSWWQILNTADRYEAMLHIDLTFLYDALNPRPGLPQAVALFAAHRARMWGFHPGARSLPVYLKLRTLAKEFAILTDDYEADELTEEDSDDERQEAEYEEAIMQQLRALGFPYRIARMGAEEALVLNPPSAAEWLRGVVLPQDREGLDGWRTPQHEGEVIDRLQRRLREMPVRLNFHPNELLHTLLEECLTRTTEETYVRPIYETLRKPNTPVEEWLLKDAIPHMNARNEPQVYQSAEVHAQTIKRDRGKKACPFSEEELVSAIRRLYGHASYDVFALTEDVQADPALLPSDPYTNPRLRATLQHNLGRMDAELRANLERGI
jgi:hypothetical protein